jgi:hypothetical protein
MPAKDSENLFPDWIKITETSEVLSLDIDVKASSVQDGRFEPGVLADSNLDKIPYQGKVVRISGAASTWMYSFFAYSAYQHEAKQIEVFYPQINDYILIYPVDTLENSETGGNYFKIEQHQDRITLTLNPNNKSIKYQDIQTNPLKLPQQQTDSFLILTGKASVYLYAYAAVVAAKSKFDCVFVDNPHERYLISVGKMSPGDVDLKKQTTNKPGLVVGIVGDPNSGKSVFAKWLYHFIKNEIPNSWKYNADVVAPTTDYFTAMIKAAPTEAEKLKNQNKGTWTSTLEEDVAARLQMLKVRFDVTIADLPGGKHNDSQNIHERIPQGREVMMHEIDWFIILGKEEKAKEIFQGWRNELRREGLEDRIIAEIVSKDHTATPSLSIVPPDGNGNLFHGVATGLDRKNAQIEELPPEIQETFRTSLSKLLESF